MPIYKGNNKIRDIYKGTIKIGKIYKGSTLVYQSAFKITYYIDTNNSKTENRRTGENCLASLSFTPSKSGYIFVGWRTDNQANSSVLSSKIVEKNAITLYAVFKKDITVTYYNNSTTASTSTKSQYYNNGNIANPSFALTQTASSGWTARGWSTSNKGNASITYNNGATFSRDSNITLYGLYQQTITVTYYNNSTTAASTNGIRYWAPAGYINPSFTLNQAAKSGWTARGWSTSSSGNGGITYNNGAAFTRDSSITLYGLYQQTITLTLYNGSTTANTKTGTRYYSSNNTYVNPTFTVSPTSLSGWSFSGWCTSNSATASVSYSSLSSTAFAANATLYGKYQQTITVTYYNNTTTAATTTGIRYWNTGNVSNPSFTLNQATRSGWIARGWSTGTAADSAISYNNATAFTRDSNITLYGMYQQTITVTYNGNGNTGGSVAADTGTRYYNSNNTTKNPTFTLKANGFTKTGYNFNGWTGAPVSTVGQTFTASSNITITAQWVAAEFVWVENSKFVGDAAWNDGIKSTNVIDPMDGSNNYISTKVNTGNYQYAYVTINRLISCSLRFIDADSVGSSIRHVVSIENNMYSDNKITTEKTYKVYLGTNKNYMLEIEFGPVTSDGWYSSCYISKIVFKN